MKRTKLLLILLTALITTATITVKLPITTAQQQASLALDPILIDTRTLKNPGDTFSLEMTVANVHNLWGYQYAIFYNTSVINCTNYVKLDERFTTDLPSEIGINYVAVARSLPNGALSGITTTDPIPLDRLDFKVTGMGTTTLVFNSPFKPTYTTLSDIIGGPIPATLVPGRFSNTQTLAIHDVGVSQASVDKTSATIGDTITITAVVENNGDFSENVKVQAKFNQSGTHGPVLTQIGTVQEVNNLATDTSSDQLTFTWDTTGLTKAAYEVIVLANVTTDDLPANNRRTAGLITIAEPGGGGGGIPMQYIYIGVGIAVVVVGVIAVYALRARKSS